MLYNFLRHLKPRRFIEIGCGMSTRLAQLALAQNEKDGVPPCKHTCIEPYESPWLEELGVTVMRQRVEEVDPAGPPQDSSLRPSEQPATQTLIELELMIG